MNKERIISILLVIGVLIVAILITVFGNNVLSKEEEKTYTTNYFTFISTSPMLEKKSDNYKVYFESLNGDIVILGIEETKSYLETLGYENLSLEDYAKLVYEKEEDAISELKLSNNKRFYYFTYDFKGSDGDYFYLGTMYETSNSFWLINFVCELKSQKKFEDKFIKWASSLKFNVN